MKPWAWALAGSVVLHLVLLVPWSRSVAPAVAVTAGTSKPAAVFTRVSLTARRAAPAAEAAPERPVAAALPRTRGATVVAAAAPVEVEIVSSDALPGEERAGDGAPTVEGTPGGGEPVAAPAGPPPAPAAPAVDLTALVHARLAAMADRCYPQAARRFSQRGTVELSFCLDAKGATASSEVTRSSGAELLDSAARGCVLEGAAPFAPEAASHCFTVPVRFGAR